MRRTIPLVIAAVLAAVPLAAQGDHAATDAKGLATAEGMPEGWMMRFDRSNATADMVSFRPMEPGWHVTTGGRGSAIFWRPATSASGTYRAESTIHLMKPAQHAEAFGIFVGGEALDADAQRYLYFVVRQTGEYLIKRRNGAATENVVGWTRHEGVPVAKTEGSTRYDLAVDVGAANVDFIVNGTTVHSLPKSELATDGTVGLRINHMLDAHVEKLEVTKR